MAIDVLNIFTFSDLENFYCLLSKNTDSSQMQQSIEVPYLNTILLYFTIYIFTILIRLS